MRIQEVGLKAAVTSSIQKKKILSIRRALSLDQLQLRSPGHSFGPSLCNATGVPLSVTGRRY